VPADRKAPEIKRRTNRQLFGYKKKVGWLVGLRTHLEGGDESIIFRKLLLQDSAQGMGNCVHIKHKQPETNPRAAHTDGQTATQPHSRQTQQSCQSYRADHVVHPARCAHYGYSPQWAHIASCMPERFAPLPVCGLSRPSVTKRCTLRNSQPSSDSVWHKCRVARGTPALASTIKPSARREYLTYFPSMPWRT
jgi:hypothetical protein